MKTDREIYTLLGSDAETLAILTDGIEVRGPYRFEALEADASAIDGWARCALPILRIYGSTDLLIGER